MVPICGPRIGLLAAGSSAAFIRAVALWYSWLVQSAVSARSEDFMARRGIFLVALFGLAGASYAYRAELTPHLPKPMADALNSAGDAIDGKRGLPIAPQVGGPQASGPRAGAGNAGSETAAKGPPAKGGGAAPVTVATAVLADMPIVFSAPGTVEPLATVAIKPRVDGQVIEVGFKEGDLVLAGSVLYKLDDRLVRSQIKQAEATIAKDQASLKDAMSIADRRETLLRNKYASEASTETARQNVEVLKASIAVGQAQLEAQRTQLDYLIIRAPITGRTGSMTARLGSFVRSAEPLALVTINQTKPIAVAFALPQVTLEAVKTALKQQAHAKVRVPGTAGSKGPSVDGMLTFVDNQIDKSTGTVTAKVTVENADEALWPGQAVNVDLTVETRTSIVTVPASAVLPAQQGMIVWMVNADNKVAVRQVVLERVIGQISYIASGLQVGDRVVTDGQLRLSPGMTVAVRGGGAPGAKSAPAAGAAAPQRPVSSGAGGG